MEIEIISTENIKPYLPTPQNLRNYNVSLLDHVIPHFPFAVVLYYPARLDTTNAKEFISESTKTLKQSLSKLLTRFYPFAGRLKDHRSIDCNDEGFVFVVAKIKSNLSDFLTKLDKKEDLGLIPCKLECSESSLGDHVAMAQVNYFNCGGMAIGFTFSHKVIDGVTMSYFLKSWSLYAYGGCTQAVCPNYILSSFFPHNDYKPLETKYYTSFTRHLRIGKTIMRRYVFNSSAISTLRDKSGDIIPRPSRVELVSAFLWKCFIISSNKSSVVTQLVNLRRRADPPLSENCFGNMVWMVASETSNYEHENVNHLENLVRKLRDSISKKVDDDFIMRMHGDDGLSEYCKNGEDTWLKCCTKEDEEILAITSWCNFGMYNVDFGWGKPIWFSRCHGGNDSESPYSNSVLLVDTNKGDGIEAWVILEEQYMRGFDNIDELRILASVNPNPFDI